MAHLADAYQTSSAALRRASLPRAVLWGGGGALIAAVIRVSLVPVIDDAHPYITIFPAVVVVGLVAGWIAGLICLLLASGAILYAIALPPDRAPESETLLALALVLVVGILLLIVAESYRRIRLSSEHTAREALKAADSLRDSEERFRRLAELSPDAILVMANGHIAYANPATLHLLRATSFEQVLNRSPFEVVHPESRADLEARLNHLLATGQPNPPMEQRYYRMDGSIVTVEMASTLVPWTGGVAVQAIARDITERKRREQELQESRRALEDFFEHSPVPIHWLDNHGRIIRANRAELEMLGVSTAEHIGRPMREIFVDPREADELLQWLCRGDSLHQFEAKLRRADGAIRYVQINANAHIEGGEIQHMRCFLLDVTDQRKAQDAIRYALDRFRLCSRATRDVIYDWDLAADTIEWNDVIATMAGDFETASVTPYDWWRQRVHHDERERVEGTLRRAIETGEEQWSAEYRFRRSDGSWATVLDRAFIAHDRDGEPTRVVGAMIDMTERRRFEDELARRAAELERSNADLRDFAHIISHDLKAPLRGIRDYARYLLEGYSASLDSDGRDMLNTLGRLSGRMHELLDALMEYARVGRAELRTARADLNAILARVIDSLSTRLEAEHVQLILANRLPTTRCDPILIEQVFTNLVVNALKYSTREDKRVEIGCMHTDDAAPILYIRDNGIGIDARHREAIFQMFRRLHPGDAFGGGTGAGLSIVKKIIERHGGRIWVESEPGAGSTFYFTLGRPEEEPPEIRTTVRERERAGE